MNLVPIPFALAVLTGIGLAFSQIEWAWIVIAAVAGLLIIILGFVSTLSAKDIPSLSIAANERLKKFAHYYMYPGTSSGLGMSCWCVQVASAIIAIIGAFDGFWWGIAFLILLVPIMSAVGNRFNPSLFFIKDGEQQTHEEILSFLETEIEKRFAAGDNR